MFAIIQSGGRQVKVSPGTVITVDRVELSRDRRSASTRSCSSRATAAKSWPARRSSPTPRWLGWWTGESRGPKIRVFKKKRRKGMRRTKGHRSTYTRVRITDIVV